MSDCCNYFQFTDPGDSFASWEGLRGPKGDPGEPGPKGDPGTGLYITGTVPDVEDLPESAPQSTIYNVGTEAPYELYMYDTEDGWISLGYLEGPEGPQGPEGPAGADGAPGAPGAAATIAVGSVSGLPAGSTPTVTNSGTSSAAVFNFGIPAGATGATGPKGPEGPPGKGLTISGTVASVSQLPATAEQGTVYNVGASEPYELYMYETGTGWISLGYLEGPEGPPGENGAAAGFGTPTISVGSGTGTPSATVTASGPDTAKVFAFAFENLKGAQGNPGTPGQDGVSPEVTIGTITGGHSVTITDADHPTGQTFNVMDGEDGAPGTPGAPGTAAGFGTPTATIGSGTGTPSVQISASGPDTAKVFAFAFENLKGAKGDTGDTGPTGPQGPQGPAVPLSDANPLMDGTAAPGTGTSAARADHVHPSDTSKANASAFKAFTVTLPAANWNSSNAQTVSNANFSASGYAYIVSPASASFADYGAAQIYADDVSTDGQMTFHCDSAPSSDLTVNVVRVVSA